MQNPSPLKLAAKWVLLDVAGAVLSAIGTYLVMEAGGQKAIGYACLAVGIPMMVFAIVQILKSARVRAPR